MSRVVSATVGGAPSGRPAVPGAEATMTLLGAIAQLAEWTNNLLLDAELDRLSASHYGTPDGDGNIAVLTVDEISAALQSSLAEVDLLHLYNGEAAIALDAGPGGTRFLLGSDQSPLEALIALLGLAQRVIVGKGHGMLVSAYLAAGEAKAA